MFFEDQSFVKENDKYFVQCFFFNGNYYDTTFPTYLAPLKNLYMTTMRL